jgi:hydrogenase expression/formation protein HypC
MCVALPARVVSVGEAIGSSIPAVARIGGIDRAVDLGMVPGAGVGDYVIVHSGFAISVVPPEEAEKTLALIARAEGL